MARTGVITYSLQVTFENEDDVLKFEKILKLIGKSNKKIGGKTYIEKENDFVTIYDNLYGSQSQHI